MKTIRIKLKDYVINDVVLSNIGLEFYLESLVAAGHGEPEMEFGVHRTEGVEDSETECIDGFILALRPFKKQKTLL